jgi:hypothetical protein
MRGPRYFVTDLNVVKDFLLTERVSTQFRAEFFNLFNNPNFKLPDSNNASGTFGRITGALDPRIVQFALKVVF